MNEGSSKGLNLFKTEDYWAIWLGMIVIALSVGFFWAGSTLKPWAVTPGARSDSGHLTADPVPRVFGLTTILPGFIEMNAFRCIEGKAFIEERRNTRARTS